MIEVKTVRPEPDVQITLDMNTARALKAVAGLGLMHLNDDGRHRMATTAGVNGSALIAIQPLYDALKEAGV